MPYEKLRSDRILSAHRTGNGLKLLTGTPADSLAQNVPLLYDANGNVLSTATRSGNTTNYATATAGAKTSGYYPKWDANGNLGNGDSGAGGGGGSIYEWTVATFDIAAAASPLELINGDQIILTNGLYKVYWLDGMPSYYYGSQKIYRPPSTGWSWDNQTTSTIDSTNGYEYLKAIKQAAVNCTWRHRTAPSAPYVITASFLVDVSGGISYDGNGQACGVMLLFRESGTGKAVALRHAANVSSSGEALLEKWTSSVSFSAAYNAYGPYGQLILGLGPRLVHMRIENDNTNLKVYGSIDNEHWHQFGASKSKTDFMAGGPDQVGWGAYCNTTTPVIALISWRES